MLVDHFGDVTEMVVDPMAAVEAGSAGLGDDLHEVTVVAVVENLSEIPTRPVLVSGIVGAADLLERGEMR